MKKPEIRYFGNAAFEIAFEKGTRILIDPCITGHNGLGASPVKLEEIKDIDLILVSHGAADHLGDTIELAMRTGCTVMCGPEVRVHLLKNGIEDERIFPMCWGFERQFRELTIKCVESRHLSFFASGEIFLSAAPLGFMVFSESGSSIYHPGDTAIFGDLKLFGELYRPQVVLTPVGGFVNFPGELYPDEAALVMKWMQPRIAIPMHYAGNPDAPYLFANLVRKEAPNTQVVILRPGEKLCLESLSTLLH